ncbi:hypothetical protein HXX76_009875 [Chlamydomonas incerta]|uniref:Uncharacterized protein n=1 Tax=Chlamydomonas incerta TaxID=51695 RepID=A0A835VVI6_CHLIN|nr:hypothetical protein HXX76_009875 [Chlamydomonas incerta]|eukprot:KAG2430902.1 hypothetical protein HXX76_009875 [Chlamydomonas incerta]
MEIAEVADVVPANLERQTTRLIRLLSAVDTFPRGGIYSGYYALQAALRYEHHWAKLLQLQTAGPAAATATADVAGAQLQPQAGGAPDGDPACAAPPGNMLPPLDVAYAWWVHRQDPAMYLRGLAAAGCGQAAATGYGSLQALGFGPSRQEEWAAWSAVSGRAPVWPPPPPGSDYDLSQRMTAAPPAFAVTLAEAMQRYAGLLHSWLRPQYLDPAFLAAARVRYARFLALRAAHPHAPLLVPAADIALMWHTHLAFADSYAAACERLFGHLHGGGGGGSGSQGGGSAAGEEQQEAAAGGGAKAGKGDEEEQERRRRVVLWRPGYVEVERAELVAGYQATAALYEQEYGEPYDDPDTSWLPLSLPYPLAAPKSPLRPLLRLFDDVPSRLEDLSRRKAADAARSCGAVALSFAPGAVPRAGAHALFAAWVAARALGREVLRAPLCACLPGVAGAEDARLAKSAATALVGLGFFLDLPAWGGHPFLAAIRQRKGLWEDVKAADAATAAAAAAAGGAAGKGDAGASRRSSSGGGGGGGGTPRAAANGGAGGADGSPFADKAKRRSAAGGAAATDGDDAHSVAGGGGGGGGIGGGLIGRSPSLTSRGTSALVAAAGGGRAALCYSADGLAAARGPLAPTFRIFDVDHFVAAYELNYEMLGVGAALVAAGVPGPRGRAPYTVRGLGSRLSRPRFVEALTKAFDQQWAAATSSNGGSVWSRIEAERAKSARRAGSSGGGGGGGQGAKGFKELAAAGLGGGAAGVRGSDYYNAGTFIPTINIHVEDDDDGGGSHEALQLAEILAEARVH